MTSLLLADDHVLIRQGIAELLSQQAEIDVVATVSDGLEVLSYLEENKVDIILMDINMPKLNGIDTTKEVTKLYPNTKVIALTMHDSSGFIEQMLKAGAKGYLLKNCGQEELLTAISQVSEGQTYVGKDTQEALIQSLSGNKKVDMMPKLTRREKEVLTLIAEELTTNQIAEKLFLSLSTVESHRANLISKFGVKNSVGVIKKAIEYGLL